VNGPCSAARVRAPASREHTYPQAPFFKGLIVTARTAFCAPDKRLNSDTATGAPRLGGWAGVVASSSRGGSSRLVTIEKPPKSVFSDVKRRMSQFDRHFRVQSTPSTGLMTWRRASRKVLRAMRFLGNAKSMRRWLKSKSDDSDD